jgi:hypothetical protein
VVPPGGIHSGSRILAPYGQTMTMTMTMTNYGDPHFNCKIFNWIRMSPSNSVGVHDVHSKGKCDFHGMQPARFDGSPRLDGF